MNEWQKGNEHVKKQVLSTVRGRAKPYGNYFA